MVASDASSSPKRFPFEKSRSYVLKYFRRSNAMLSAFCETKSLSTAVGQRSTMVGLQRLYCEVCLQCIRIFVRFGDIRFVGIYNICFSPKTDGTNLH